MFSRFKHLLNVRVNPRAVFEFFVNIVVVIAAVFIIRNYFISPFQVYGPSMCDSFNVYHGQCLQGGGEYLLLNKAIYQNFFGFRHSLPKRGDVVIFRPPHNGREFFIKRVIGLPGERVQLRDGNVFINDVLLEEMYLSEHSRGRTYPSQGEKDFLVPEGRYFVLGDNRQASSDSRRCFSDFGCIGNGQSPYLPFDVIEGKAWIVLWPFSHARVISDPFYSSFPSK